MVKKHCFIDSLIVGCAEITGNYKKITKKKSCFSEILDKMPFQLGIKTFNLFLIFTDHTTGLFVIGFLSTKPALILF